MGENGAGKSTLMNIIYGLLRRDGGDIVLQGHEVNFGSPASAIAAGVCMVHQHFKLSPSFTVAENVILGSEPLASFNRVDYRRAEQDVLALSQKFGIELDPKGGGREAPGRAPAEGRDPEGSLPQSPDPHLG